MTTLTWYCPVSRQAPITQTFSQHPGYGKGIDFALITGSAIMAMRSGRVSQVIDRYAVGQTGSQYGYGNLVVLDHGQLYGAGYVSYYAHLHPGIPVKPGELVTVGQIIGKSDNNGFSSGPHLHAETRRNNVPFDWWPYRVYSSWLVDGGDMQEFIAPVIPVPFTGRVIATPSLNIRQRPSTQAKIIGGLAAGTTVNVISGAWYNSDYWIQIGYEQYCAVYFGGKILVEIEKT